MTLAFHSGRLLPAGDVAVPMHDAGFVFGATIVDTCRTFRHRLFRLDDHLERFLRGCSYASIPIPFTQTELREHAERLVANNARLLRPEQDLSLILLATPGPIDYYLGSPGGPGDGEPSIWMHTFALPMARYRSLIAAGARLAVPTIRALPAECVDPTIKTRSRMHWWLADREVRLRHPGTQALLLDQHGNVTETATSNLLIAKAGVLIAPPTDSVLAGVRLQQTETICRRLGIALERRAIALDECIEADEAMLTCTSFCIAGVSEIQGRAIPWPGSIFRRLVQEWNAEVGMDVHAQIIGA